MSALTSPDYLSFIAAKQSKAPSLGIEPGDVVLSPFMGIGSEGYEAIRLGRKFVGAELKRSYFDLAVKNLRQSQNDKAEQGSLFHDL